MSGYTPVFRTVFEGSLCGQYPDTAAWLFLLALADKDGCVDKSPEYICAVTGMDIDDLLACINRFMQPDPLSRTTEHEGRRLEKIDPQRPWGWRILNHGKYRERARQQAQSAAQIADGRNAEKVRRYKERHKDTTGHRETPQDTLSNTNTNSNSTPSLRSGVQGGKPPARARKRCPDDFVIPPEAVERMRAECPQVDIGFETRRFRDYEFATAKTDWLATWRNWMRKAQEGASQSVRPTRYAQLMAEAQAPLDHGASELTKFLEGAK